MKKALSILLAVLMLASLCGPMAFADDVVVEEEANEVVAGEPVGEAVSGEDSFDAADAFVDEYVGEGSFDAAYTRSVDDILDMLNNGWSFVHWVTKPTCTVDGVVELSYDGGDPEPFGVAAFGHDWSEWVAVIDEEATCTQEGWRHYERECTTEVRVPELELTYVCTATEKDEGEPVPMLQCKFYMTEEGETCLKGDPDCWGPAAYKIVEWPNCVMPGNPDAREPVIDGTVVVVCAMCGREDPDSEPLTGYLDLGPFLEYVPLDPIDKNYVKNGDFGFPTFDRFVSLDRDVIGQDLYEELKYNFHEWGDWTWKIEATCTKDGYRVHYCDVCRRQEDQFVEKYNHIDPETGETAYVPTRQVREDCYHYTQYFQCYLCGDVQKIEGMEYENPVHRYSLDWDEETDPATCMHPGTAYRTCDDCGYVDTRVLPQLAHSYSDVTRTAFIYENYDNVNIAPKDHYMHWLFCENCGAALNPNDDIVAFLQGVENGCVIPLYSGSGFGIKWLHDWGDWVCYVQPTEGTQGHWFRECKIMHDEDFPNDPNCAEREEFVGTQAEFESMTGTHDWSEPTILWNAPEGEDTLIYTCETCGEIKYEYRPHEHVWGDPEFVGYGVETDTWKHTCETCETVEEFETPHNHVWGEWTFVKYGEEADEYERTCATCGWEEVEYRPHEHVWSEWKLVEYGEEVDEYERTCATCDMVEVEYRPHEHVWGDWEVVDVVPGGLFEVRTCETCGATEDRIVPPPKEGLIYEIEEGKPVYKLYEDDVFQEDFTGLYEWNDGLFFVVDGYVPLDVNGANMAPDGTWYFLSQGKVADDYTGLALYNGEWFVVENGVVDFEYNGLYEYNGKLFVVAAGKNDQTLNGLWLNDESLKDGDGKWYWIANGMWIDDYTGIAVYGGEEFYVENGIMIPDYTGEAVYNGYTFIMENGKIVAQAA